MIHDPWYREADCSVADFAASLEGVTDPGCLEFACDVQRNIPIYDCAALRAALDDPAARPRLLGEWLGVLLDGAGVFLLHGAFSDTRAIDEATAVFEAIIVEERESGTSGADHFAQPGANDRIWNALEKLCIRAPGVFARYYGNRFLAAAAQAWLGPLYQVTSQVNVVRPGGEAQEAHRDYHLGFQTVEDAQRYPAHVHRMSPLLTLQGAVAHGDMPVDSGPTKLLPFSQRYARGYLAWRRQDFRDYFERHCVQLPLAKGDALFLSPALFHAAGSNRTAHISRMANLLQISSAYGRAMESVNRVKMCEALYPVLRAQRAEARLDATAIAAAIASSAEGYPFPTVLDADPPIGGLAPMSQQMLFQQALDEDWPADRFIAQLRVQAERRQA
jgi:ectoine hydroxylase-related dioxygenase (phytanoyl-CoA dioxygenase family)